MINMIKNKYKKESTIILACILIIIVFCIFFWIKNNVVNKIELFRRGGSNSKRDKMIKMYKSNDVDKIELFNGNNNSSSNSKRDRMRRIYKSNEVSDPDEIVTSYPDDDDCDDPDGTCGSDPDS